MTTKIMNEQERISAVNRNYIEIERQDILLESAWETYAGCTAAYQAFFPMKFSNWYEPYDSE